VVGREEKREDQVKRADQGTHFVVKKYIDIQKISITLGICTKW
jgi:hypothetical protein